MFLLRSRKRSCSIHHPLAKLKIIPKSISDARLAELLPLLKIGDVKAVDEVIKGFVCLVIKIAGQYRTQRNQTHDLVSEGLLGLTIGCRAVAKGMLRDDNVGAYLVGQIHAKMCDYVKNKKDSLVRIPSTSAWRHKTKTGKTPEIKCQRLDHHTERMLVVQPDGINMIELKDLINSCLKNDTEKQIIALRAESFRDNEIAIQLGMSNTSVARIRSQIEDRFLNLEKI